MAEFAVKALILDWAGTVIDHGSCAPAYVFCEIFRRRGVDITMAQAREPMGRAKREHIAAITQMPAVADAWQKQLGTACTDADIDAMYAEFIPLQKSVIAEHAVVIEGAAAAIQYCREQGLKIGSSTGYTRELMEIVTPLAREQGYAPDCVLCAEDAVRGRPTPYLIYEAARRLDVFPLRSVVKVDDTPVGIEAGRHAGCWTVGVTRTGNAVGLSAADWQALPASDKQALLLKAEQSLRAAGAHEILESVADIASVLNRLNTRIEDGEHPDTQQP